MLADVTRVLEYSITKYWSTPIIKSSSTPITDTIVCKNHLGGIIPNLVLIPVSGWQTTAAVISFKQFEHLYHLSDSILSSLFIIGVFSRSPTDMEVDRLTFLFSLLILCAAGRDSPQPGELFSLLQTVCQVQR